MPRNVATECRWARERIMHIIIFFTMCYFLHPAYVIHLCDQSYNFEGMIISINKNIFEPDILQNQSYTFIYVKYHQGAIHQILLTYTI